VKVDSQRGGPPSHKVKLKAGSLLADLAKTMIRKAALAIRPELFLGEQWLDPALTLLELGVTNSAELRGVPNPAVLTCSKDGTAKLWNPDTGICELSLEGHTDAVNSAVYSSDCKMILTSSDDKSAKVWSVSTGECLMTFKGHKDALLSAIFSDDCNKVLTTSEDGTAKTWGVKHGLCEKTFKHGTTVLKAVFADNMNSIRTHGQDGTVKLWNIKTGIRERTLNSKASSTYLDASSFAPDGKSYISPGGEGAAKIFNIETGRCQVELIGHDDLVLAASFAPTA